MNTKTITTLLLIAALTASTTAQNGPTTSFETTLINTDPEVLQSGESGDLTFKIRNTGDTESGEVKVELLDHYPFKLKPDRERNHTLYTMYPGEEYHISTEVLLAEDAPDGSNDFKVKIHHEDFSVTKNVPIEVQSENIDLNLANLETKPSQLMPDTENNKIKIDVVNNGEKKAENAVLELEFPTFFEQRSSFSTRHALGNIEEGETKTANFDFDINESAPKGPQTIQGQLSYTPNESDSTVSEEVSFDVYLDGKPQFKVVETESNLEAGSKKQLRIKVKNTGEEKSTSTRIRALDSSDQPFSYDSSSQYIGTLEAGKTGTAVFIIETEEDAPSKEYLLDFELRGVKNTEVYVEEQTIQTLVENNSQKSSIPIPLLIAPILILGGIAYLFINRLKSKKQ